MSLIEQIEQGLTRLYQKHGHEYDGKFKEICEENGFDDEDFEEELAMDNYEESQFDEDAIKDLCPWITSSDRHEKIFKHLCECFINPNAYDSRAHLPDATNIEYWKITDFDLNLVRNELNKIAPSIYEAGFHNDVTLKNMYAVEMKMKRNYVQFLADVYMREYIYNDCMREEEKAKRIKENKVQSNQKKEDKEFTVVKWSRRNNYMKLLMNMEPQRYDGGGKGSQMTPGQLVESAIKSYFGRVAPKLILSAMQRIKGDLKQLAEHIASTCDFVANLANSADATCPFQYDTVFAFAESTDMKEDEDDNDDDDDDDEDDNQNDNGKVRAQKAIASLADVEGELDGHKLVHIPAKLGGKIETEKQTGGRMLKEALDLMKTEKNHRSNLPKDYPRHNRFCSIVDMRDEDEADRDVVMFEGFGDGEKELDVVPAGIHTALGHFHRSKSNIIPNKNNAEVTTAVSLGPHITLSFHVEEQNDMRCYLFVNGQCARFLAEDIVLVLPKFFEQSEKNMSFSQHEEAKFIINRIKDKLQDATFDAFVRKYDVKYVPAQLEKDLKTATEEALKAASSVANQ